jgi:hypothetical protein
MDGCLVAVNYRIGLLSHDDKPSYRTEFLRQLDGLRASCSANGPRVVKKAALDAIVPIKARRLGRINGAITVRAS